MCKDSLRDFLGKNCHDPKKEENPKRQKVRAVVSLAAAVALLILISVLTPFAKQYQSRYFEMAPLYLLRYVLQPFAFVLFGWGVVEAGRAFAGLRIWEDIPKRTIRNACILFYVLAACLVLAAVLTLWTGADMVYMWYLAERAMRLQGSFESSSVPHLMPDRLRGIFLRITIVYCANILNGICLLWGAALNVFRIKKEELDQGNEIKGQD